MKREGENKKTRKYRWGHSFFIHLLVFSLMQPQVVLAEAGQTTVQKDKWAGQIIGTLNTVTGEMRKANQKMMAEARQAAIMQSYRPQPVMSKYFPGQCQVGMAITNFPENVCRKDMPADPTNPVAMAEAKAFQKIAIDNVSFFDKLMSAGQNAPTPVGLQCLEDQKKRELSKINDLINRLKAEAEKFKQQLENFRQANKRLVDDMTKLNCDLNGTQACGREDIDNKHKDFAEYFSPSCTDILGTTTLEDANRGGLFNLRKNPQFQQKYKNAVSANKNKGAWETDLARKISKIKAEIKKRGPAAVLGQGGANFGSLTFDKGDSDLEKSMKEIADRESKEFLKDFQTAQSFLQKELGYALPNPDQNFSSLIDNFKGSAADYFRNKMVGECIGGRKYSGESVALGTQQILDNLRQNNTTTRGTNVSKYRARLQSILAKDMSPEAKLKEIQALDKVFGVGTISVMYDNNGKTMTQTPYDLFMSIKSNCEARVDQDQTNSTAKQSQSDAWKIKEGTRYLQQISSKVNEFASKLGNSIHDQVANCGGRTIKADSCTAQSMDANQDSFCIKQASFCSDRVRGCMGEVKQQITHRQKQLKTLGKQWDAQVTDLINRQRTVLENRVKPMVVGAMEMIKRYMPGADYKYNSDTFVKMPELQDSKFGIQLLAGGDVKNLDQLPQLIEKNLVSMLEDQKNNLDSKYKEYIKGQRDAMKTNRDKWAKVQSACEGMQAKLVAAAQKYNTEGQKAQDEMNSQRGEFCAKYRLLQSNPAAGCGESDVSPDKLYLDANKISAMLDPSVEVNLTAFSRYCSSYNNEKKSDKDGDEGAEYSKLAELCSENNNKYSDVIDQVKASVLAGFSGSTKSKIEDYLDGKEDAELPDDLSYPQRRAIKNARSLVSESADYAKPEDFFEGAVLDELAEVKNKKEIYEKLSGKISKITDAAKKTAAEGQLDEIKSWDNDNKPMSSSDIIKLSLLLDSGELKSQGEGWRNEFLKKKHSEIKNITDHIASSKFKATGKSADSNGNICIEQENYIKLTAALACADKSKGDKCFKNKLDENVDSKPDRGAPQSVDRKIASVMDNAQKSAGAKLGEQANGPCEANTGAAGRIAGGNILDFGLDPENASFLRDKGL